MDEKDHPAPSSPPAVPFQSLSSAGLASSGLQGPEAAEDSEMQNSDQYGIPGRPAQHDQPVVNENRRVPLVRELFWPYNYSVSNFLARELDIPPGPFSPPPRDCKADVDGFPSFPEARFGNPRPATGHDILPNLAIGKPFCGDCKDFEPTLYNFYEFLFDGFAVDNRPNRRNSAGFYPNDFSAIRALVDFQRGLGPNSPLSSSYSRIQSSIEKLVRILYAYRQPSFPQPSAEDEKNPQTFDSKGMNSFSSLTLEEQKSVQLAMRNILVCLTAETQNIFMKHRIMMNSINHLVASTMAAMDKKCSAESRDAIVSRNSGKIIRYLSTNMLSFLHPIHSNSLDINNMRVNEALNVPHFGTDRALNESVYQLARLAIRNRALRILNGDENAPAHLSASQIIRVRNFPFVERPLLSEVEALMNLLYPEIDLSSDSEVYCP